MEEQLLEITFMKFYGVINDIAYDCEHFLRRLRVSDLISEESCRHIGNQKETFEKNRYGKNNDVASYISCSNLAGTFIFELQYTVYTYLQL